MSLIKGVASKGFNEVKDLLGYLSRKSIFLRPGNEATPLFFHNLGNLLPHCLAKDVSLPQAITSDGPHNKQHLVLIHNYPIGFLKDAGQGRMGIADRFQALLGFDEGRDMLHWSRAIQGYHSRNIAKGSRLKLLNVATHAHPLKLKHACCLP